MIFYREIASPLGKILLTADGEFLTGVFFEGQKYHPERGGDWQESVENPLLRRAGAQLDEYFTGRRQSFDLPLAPAGTEFQRQVWRAIARVPFGRTSSYGELAAEIGRESAARAVGAATGRNPLSLVIPCHRIVAGSGALTGYAGGMDRKQALLRLEGA